MFATSRCMVYLDFMLSLSEIPTTYGKYLIKMFLFKACCFVDKLL